MVTYKNLQSIELNCNQLIDLKGNYEKVMKFMNFFDSSEDTSYEVKDPDLLRMQSQNEKLKEALDEANQTVKQIQNVFTAQTVSRKPCVALFLDSISQNIVVPQGPSFSF